MRDYLNTTPALRNSPEFEDLWTQAAALDFMLADCATQQQVATMLATSDLAELFLRRIAALVYVKRTGDRTGAAVISAVAPPGSRRDLAPDWLVTSAASHSKLEGQIADRVNKNSGMRQRGEQNQQNY